MSDSKGPSPYCVMVDFVPDRGFVVTISLPGGSQVCPDAFVSLQHAVIFAGRELSRTGFAVALTG